MLDYAVIIPSYNAAQFIERAIQSCLAQTLPAAAIIVIDDASTDNTAQVLESYIQSGTIIYHKFESNQGVSAARNKGRALANAEWLAFLDSDDEWHPQKMEFCSAFLDLQKTKTLAHLFQYENWNEQKLVPNKNLEMVSFSKFLLHNSLASCTLIIHQSLELEYDDSMRFCEDHDFLLRIAYLQDIPVLQMKLAQVHRKINSKGGLSGQLWKMRLGEIKMYSKLYRLNGFYALLFPFLLVYSLLKHLRLLLRISG